MKKLLNDPTTFLAEALVGIAKAHPDQHVDTENRVIYRATP